jgi:nicotinamide mononucleotide transporter
MNGTEIFGFVTGVVNVWLLAKQVVWNWPIGLANNAAYLLLFARTGLYGDAGLQFLYITLGVYGWWLWLHPSPGQTVLPVRRTTALTWKLLGVATLCAAVGLSFFLARFTDSTVPRWDGVTTAVSLAATWGQCRKLVESWWLWIAADLIYIPLYIYKGLWLTAALYFVFMLLCVVGLRTWTRELTSS